MTKLLLVATILIGATGFYRGIRQQSAAAAAERDRLAVDLAETGRLLVDVTNQLSRLEAEWSLAQTIQTHLPPSRPPSNPPQSVIEPFGPPDGSPSWPETGRFVWIEKEAIPSLGLSAFIAADSIDPHVPADAARLITRVSRAFVEAHPDPGSLTEVSPEKAAELQAAYQRMLAEAAAGLDERGRRAIENTIRQIEGLPVAGRMAQPTAEYRLNGDVAELLGLTAVERELIERLTRDIVERHRALEQGNVALSGNHSAESAGPNTARITFKVAAFPAEGRALREEWVSQLAAIVGVDRSRHFQEMSARWIRSDLGDFGEAERAITFREGGGSFGISDRSSLGFNNSMGTGGPTPVPPGWRHLIARPPDGGLPRLRAGQ